MQLKLRRFPWRQRLEMRVRQF